MTTRHKRLIAAVLCATSLAACSSTKKVSLLDSTVAVPKAQPGQSTVYVVDRRRAVIRAAAVKMAAYFKLPPQDSNGQPELETWEDWKNPGASVVADYSSGDVSYGDFGGLGVSLSQYDLGTAVSDEVAQEAIAKIIDDFELVVSGSEFFPSQIKANRTSPPFLSGSAAVEGVPLDDLAFPITVGVGEGGKIILLRTNGSLVKPIGVLDELTLEEALAADGRGMTVDQAKAKPTKIFTTEKINDEITVLIPAWQLPILKDVSTGIVINAVNTNELNDLIDELT
jgi:hypothetical protein